MASCLPAGKSGSSRDANIRTLYFYFVNPPLAYEVTLFANAFLSRCFCQSLPERWPGRVPPDKFHPLAAAKCLFCNFHL